MTRHSDTDAPQQQTVNSSPDLSSRLKDPAPPRLGEIMVYAAGLILVMIIAWYHDPYSFF